MNIDLKKRIKNKAFWVAFMSGLVLLSQQLGLNIFPDNIEEIVNTILGLLVLLGIIIDPSTEGITDKKEV